MRQVENLPKNFRHYALPGIGHRAERRGVQSLEVQGPLRPASGRSLLNDFAVQIDIEALNFGVLFNPQTDKDIDDFKNDERADS